MFELSIKERVIIASGVTIFMAILYCFIWGASFNNVIFAALGAFTYQLVDWVVWIGRNLDKYGVDNE